MGLFDRKPKIADQDLPYIHPGDYGSFTLPGTALAGVYGKVLKLRGHEKLKHGESSDKFEIVIRVIGTSAYAEYQGHRFGQITDPDGARLVGKAATAHGLAFRCRAHIWRNKRDGSYGLRIYLPEDHR